jgi:hypothetical protein
MKMRADDILARNNTQAQMITAKQMEAGRTAEDGDSAYMLLTLAAQSGASRRVSFRCISTGLPTGKCRSQSAAPG